MRSIQILPLRTRSTLWKCQSGNRVKETMLLSSVVLFGEKYLNVSWFSDKQVRALRSESEEFTGDRRESWQLWRWILNHTRRIESNI